MVARRYILKGRVQGVAFRYFTYAIAQDLGIKGWVKNLRNGDVEVHAEGDESSMKQFLTRVKSGPSLAFVEHTEVRDVEPDQYRDFTIEF
ncbi:acylphosphatase [Acidobacteria bacterium AH-259-O06]|nr:acylphosphatase [Acidobacteria bacterium AH-259-O06]